jgi:hypothetical protein
MKTCFYSTEEKLHLKYIEDNSPIRIWFEHIQYVFEYDKFYFTLEIEIAEKVLEQFAMKTSIKFIDKKFVAQEGSELLIESEKIEKLEVARTKLFFAKQTKTSENFYISESGQIKPNQNSPENAETEIEVDAGIILRFENGKVFNLLIIDNDDDFEITNFSYREGDFEKVLSDRYQFIALS